jgi:hypothetical protein
MNLSNIIQRYIPVLILLAALLPVTAALAEDNLADIQRRIDQLQNEAAQTTDLNRLMGIAAELGELSTTLQRLSGIVPAIPPGRGKTPDEEINREIQAINGAYERQKIAIAGYKDPDARQLVPFLSARKLHGSIEVRGSNQRLPSETPYNGGVLRTLQYTIKEDFVGYLITTEYYDPKTGKFTDKLDYGIKTISRKIPAPVFSGKECVETFSPNWKACKKWEPYGSYRLAGGDTYPAIHDWTVMGTPDDDGIMIDIETPDMVFSTVNNSRSRSQGCFGANTYVSNVDFEMDIEDGKLTVQEQVGGDFGGTPHCGRGSTVTLNIELCPKVPRCDQLEALLAKVLWAIELRDKFEAISKVAESVEDLLTKVNLDLNERYPDLDIQDEKFLKENAGGYDIQTGEIVLPNLCRGCATMPLCMWDREGLRIHEKTHELDVLANPDLKRLFTDTQYQLANFTANELARAQARAWGEMDRHAYDENARYLMDILQMELSQSTGCDLPPNFYVDLDKALEALK